LLLIVLVGLDFCCNHVDAAAAGRCWTT